MTAYATLDDFERWGLGPKGAERLPDGTAQAALDSANSEAEGRLAARYRMPLLAWGDDLREMVCAIAALKALDMAGWAPEGADERIETRAREARQWFRDVAERRLHPTGITQTAPAAFAPVVISDPPRGW